MWDFLLELAPKVVSSAGAFLVLWWLSPNLMRGLGLVDDDDDEAPRS